MLLWHVSVAEDPVWTLLYLQTRVYSQNSHVRTVLCDLRHWNAKVCSVEGKSQPLPKRPDHAHEAWIIAGQVVCISTAESHRQHIQSSHGHFEYSWTLLFASMRVVLLSVSSWARDKVDICHTQSLPIGLSMAGQIGVIVDWEANSFELLFVLFLPPQVFHSSCSSLASYSSLYANQRACLYNNNKIH